MHVWTSGRRTWCTLPHAPTQEAVEHPLQVLHFGHLVHSHHALRNWCPDNRLSVCRSPPSRRSSQVCSSCRRRLCGLSFAVCHHGIGHCSEVLRIRHQVWDTRQVQRCWTGFVSQAHAAPQHCWGLL